MYVDRMDSEIREYRRLLESFAQVSERLGVDPEEIIYSVTGRNLSDRAAWGLLRDIEDYMGY